MSSTKAVTAPPLSWKTPRDTGSSHDDAQRSIRLGYLTAIGTKDKEPIAKELCRSRGTFTRMRAISAPPTAVKQAASYAPPSMPPSSKDPARQAEPVRLQLDEDLVERTRYILVYVQISLNELACQGNEWKHFAEEFWGITEEPTAKLPGPATPEATNKAISELIQILLVEGALLFGRAEFDKMDRVRKAVEACQSVQRNLQPQA